MALFKFFQKIEKEERPNSFYKATITLIPNSDKDNTGKLQANISDECTLKNAQPNTIKLNSTHIKRIVHYDQVKFILGIHGWFNIGNLINVTYYINRRENKTHMIITIDAEKKHFTKFKIFS